MATGLDRLAGTWELSMMQRVSWPRGALQSSRQPWMRGTSHDPFAMKTRLLRYVNLSIIPWTSDGGRANLEELSQRQPPLRRMSRVSRLNWKYRFGMLQLCQISKASGPFGSRSIS